MIILEAFGPLLLHIYHVGCHMDVCVDWEILYELFVDVRPFGLIS